MSRRRMEDERGFTLIELLVVILVIGVLAAIALPAFLGQRAKAQDTEAKSDARNAVSEVESCFAEEADYTQCNDLSKTNLDTTTVTATGAADGFAITATSESGNKFTITRKGDYITHTCSKANTGSCLQGGTW